MKLRTLDCKNCAAPLRQEGEVLVCKSCGSVFNIPKDANDVEYDKIINAEDYIRLELAKSLLELENKYKTQEQINQEARDRAYNERRKRIFKIVGLITLIAALATLVGGLFEGGIWAVMIGISLKKNEAAKATETVVWDPGYLITPSDLKADKDFWNYISDGIIKETKEGYDSRGSVIFSSDEIWGVNTDPEVIGRYLFTSDDGNVLYIIFKVTFENVDGSKKEMYYCCASEKIKLDANGKIVYDRFQGQDTDTHEDRFHSETDLNSIYEKYINDKKTDSNWFCFEF